MRADAISTALSGIRSGSKKIDAASHNVANLLTEDFKPLRATQSEVAEGGSRATLEQSATPETVDVAKEVVNATLGGLQMRASAQVLETKLGLIGNLLDILG